MSKFMPFMGCLKLTRFPDTYRHSKRPSKAMEARVLKHITSLGCTSKLKAALAYQLYIELFEVMLMYDVDFAYNNNLEIIYLTAKTSKNSSVDIFIPYSTSETITPQYIQEMQNELCDKTENKSITIACVEGDSTIVFYNFTSGLVNVKNPESLTRQKSKEDRRAFLENEIRKNKDAILLEAHKQTCIDD